jgi:hypothetical protein
MSEYLSLEALVTPPATLEEVDVEVPALGGKVRLRAPTVAMRSAFELSVQGASRAEIRQRLLVASIIIPKGLTQQHVSALGQHDARVLEPVFEEAARLWGFRDSDIAALEKNSDATAISDGS